MASRHEIVTIDFRANAAKANPAMKSLQQAAHDLREEIDKTRSAATEAAKNGAPEAELQKFENELISQIKTLKQYDSAINTLSKGVGTLARAIDAFNAGTLDKMNAAFQKQSFNAAENAKKLLVPGSEGYEKNMAELDALQQKNLENLAKYKLRTEQLLQSIGEGGKISVTDLKTEADGLEELMKLLPHLGNEWQEYYQILMRVRDAIKQQADEEKRLKGTIVDANDARERSAQLTRQGAENARQQHEAAKKEADSHTAIIEKLKEEREEKRKNMADTASILQQKDKEIEKQKKAVAAAESAVDNEKRDVKAREKRIETLKQENETLQTTADTNRKTVEQMKGDLKGLHDELDGVNAELEKMGKAAPAAAEPATPSTAVKKEEVQVVNEKAEADKKEEQTVKNKTKAKKEETQAIEETTAAKEQEVKAGEKVVENEKKEVFSKKELRDKVDGLVSELKELYNQKNILLEQQKEDAAAAKEEESAREGQAKAIERVVAAYGQLSAEQAKAMLENKQVLATITKGDDGKFAFTNAEEAQHYILDYVQKLGGKSDKNYSLGGKQVKTLLDQFKERYGMASDEDTVGAIRGLFANGGLMDSGTLNPFIQRLYIKATDAAADYARQIKDLTVYIEKETGAINENNAAAEKFIATSNKLGDVESKITEKEQEKVKFNKLLARAENGEIETTETLTQKKQQLTEAQKRRVEAIKAETEAIKKMSKEEAETALNASKEASVVKYKRGNLYTSNIEEVQRWLIGQMKDLGAAGSDGTLKLTGTKVTDLVKNFKTRYNAVDKNAPETDLTFAKQLLGDVLKSGEGMLAFGDTNLKGSKQSITIEYIKDIFNALIEKNKQLIVAKTGAKKADDEETESIEENTEAAKKNAEAVNEESEAIKKQRELVADLKNKWEESKRKFKEYNDKYNKDIRESKRLKKGSMDEQLAGEELADKAETYKAQYVDTEKDKRENYKKLYGSARSTLDKMLAQQTQEATTAENQNTEAVDRNTGSRRRKKKATEEVTDAQKEQNKVEGEAIKQGQQLSAEEQRKQELLKRQGELQGQINEKQTEANRLEEEAAGADTKKANNLKTITDLQNENINAHTKNKQALGLENEKLEKLENQQTQNIKKYNEAKNAVQDYDKQIDEHASIRAEANKRAAQTERLTIDAMNDAIKALEEENRAIEPQSAKWNENARVIQEYRNEIARLKAEEDRLKQQPVLQMMTERMGNIKTLSTDALAETKKFWQAVEAGADRGSMKMEIAAGNLRVIAEEERQRNLEAQNQMRTPMREQLGRINKLSADDLAETKKYWETVRDGAEAGSNAYKKAELAVKALSNEEKRRKNNAQAQYINDQMKELNSLSVSGLAEVKRYWEAMANGAKYGSDEAKDAANALRQINALENDRQNAQAVKVIGNMGAYSDAEIKDAIKAFEQLRDAQAHGSAEWETYNEHVQEGKKYLEEWAQVDSIIKYEGQMSNLTTLSDAALQETKKFWETMVAGADKGSSELKQYEAQLERVTQEERIRQNAQAVKVIGNMGAYSDAEINDAIKAFEQLRDAQAHGSAEWETYNEHVQEGKKYLEEWAQVDSIIKYEGQMSNLTTLSDAALQETKKFWETMVAGADKGSSELKQYEAQLERVTQEERERNQMANEMKAQKLGGRYADMSEQEIREAIEAGTQLIKTYDSGSEEAKVLSERLVRASEYLKQHGTEALRVAQQEAEAIRKRQENDRLMKQQLDNIGSGMSQSALKAQEQYWQRLIDDPKTAASSLDTYRQNLEKVKMLQDLMAKDAVSVAGEDTLSRLRGDVDYENKISENQRKEDVAALQAYRDALPKEGNLSVLHEIDDYLKQLGVSAKESERETMTLTQALDLAKKAGTDDFMATPQEIQQATKAINQQRDAIIKTIKVKRDSGKATDDEEKELADLTNKLKALKFEQDNFNMSQAKMQELMRTPTNAVSLDELKTAIKRADGELHRMQDSLGKNSKEYKEFAARVQNAKNVLKEMEGQAKATSSAWEKAWSRLKTYVVMYMGFNVLWQKFTGTFGDLLDLSDKLGEVRKTTGFTADEVGRLSDNLKKLDTRTTINGLLELSAAAGQLGLKTQEDVEGFTIAANKLMVALPEMGREGATEMLKVALATGEIKKIQDQMNEGLVDGSSATAVAMEKVGSTIDRLRASSAATAPAITDFVKRVGAVGAQSGISIDQVAALGSTIDALGMRVEMSATALSRMIPAIKNNAFAIGKIIGKTETEILDKFKNGQGMEIILDIFDAIRKDVNVTSDDIINNTENMAAAADKVEGMFGGSMKEVMKELNQQGARAGIVFAGLSQNVDELRRLLGVASEAYKENTAIQMEYDKMNETAAAKWERLKNQMEEFLVGDSAQRFLGSVVDGLRLVVDLLTGNLRPSLQWITDTLHLLIIYWGTLKLGLGEGLIKAYEWFEKTGKTLKNLVNNTQEYIILSRRLRAAKLAEAAATTTAEKATAAQCVATIKAKMAQQALNKEMLANVWMAVAAAVFFLTVKIIGYINAAAEAAKETGRMAAEFVKAEQAVEKNFKAVTEASSAIKDANKKLKEAQENLKKAKDGLDGTKESTDRLKEAEDKLKEAEDELKKANDAHRVSIAQINKEYGQYLGFMLSEISSAAELANARELVNQKLRDGIILRRKEAAVSRIEEGGEAEKRDEYYGTLAEKVRGLELSETTIKKKDKDGNIISETVKVANTAKNEEVLKKLVKFAQSDEYPARWSDRLKGVKAILEEAGYEGELEHVIQGYLDDYRWEYKKVEQKISDVESQYDVMLDANRKESQQTLTKQYFLSSLNYQKLLHDYEDAKGEDRKQAAADLLKQMDAIKGLNESTSKSFKLDNEEERAQYENLTASFGDSIKRMESQREELEALAGDLYKPKGGNDKDNPKNPYGSYSPMDPYEKWDADALVKRKKTMLEYVKKLANGADVMAVLKQDAKFIDEATRKGIKNERDAIEWYNSERLKIQKELADRHLTNEGNWANPKKAKDRKKKQVYSESVVAELDRYYAWRKEEVERQRAEEGISEAEYNRRIETLEQEHLERRSKLRWTFTHNTTKAEKEEVAQYWKWWSSVKELDQDIEHALIEAEWKVADARDKAYNNRDAQKDLTAMNAIVVKQMKAIEDIISKERPYNGITENLEKNLTTMGVLFADFDRKRKEMLEKDESVEELDKLYATDKAKRLMFVLEQSEEAYTLTWEDMMKRMADAGMQAWADEIQANPKMQLAIMAEMRSTYDAIQSAIKKEATQIKKETDIWWNDLMPGQQTSRKGGFEKVLSQIGLAEDQIKRANSLIGAGQASERVADKLAIKQMQIRLQMQDTYYKKMRQIGEARIQQLRDDARLERENGRLEEARRKEQDAEHLARSLNLSLAEEQKKLDEQRVAIVNQLEESQNRLYKELKDLGDLIAESMKGVFEASHAGDAEYYNERAKLELTGKGGPGAGTYIVIENEGTDDAKAHYEYLDERQALERQHEIERENAQAEAWKKVMDDINMKLSETITDQMNAMLQNRSIDLNTDATTLNTAAIEGLTEAVGKGLRVDLGTAGQGADLRPEPFEPQKLELTVDSTKAVKDLTAIPGVSLTDNTLTLKFDSKDAVKAFQKANNLKVDGVVGPQTLAALEKYGIRKGSEFQYNGNDGSRIGFDDEAAVKAFQKEHGITPTGTVGDKTMAKLSAMGAQQTEVMKLVIDLNDKDVLERVEKIGGMTLDKKTVEVTVDDVAALKKLSGIEGVSIANKTVTVIADDANAEKSLQAIGAEKIGDKTFRVTFNDKDTVDSLAAIDNIRLQDKSFKVSVEKEETGNVQEVHDTPLPSYETGTDFKDFPKGSIFGRLFKDNPKVDPHDSDTWGRAARKREGLPTEDNEPDYVSTPSMADLSPEASGELERNTKALRELTEALGFVSDSTDKEDKADSEYNKSGYNKKDPDTWGYAERKRAGYRSVESEPDLMSESLQPADPMAAVQLEIDADNELTRIEIENAALRKEAKQDAAMAGAEAVADGAKKEKDATDSANRKMVTGTQSAFAKMTQAANLYGVAYQAMSNDNLSTAQKFQMIALQAAGNAAIAGLTVAMEEATAKTAVNTAQTASKDTAEHGSIIGPVLTALSTAVLGGLMGLAASKIMKSKSQIAQVTGASASAGKLATGMLTYAEGNVNEFTDPATLTEGRTYNVDAADGKTYRAKYMGRNAKTHITNGPEFHLSGEKGREMIIDAGTTRQITMNEREIWHTIQTLSSGGRISRRMSRHGMAAFADGNVGEFTGGDGVMTDTTPAVGLGQLAALQTSLDRQNELLDRALREGIKGVFDVYNKGGLVDTYDTAKKTLNRHGERY